MVHIDLMGFMLLVVNMLHVMLIMMCVDRLVLLILRMVLFLRLLMMDLLAMNVVGIKIVLTASRLFGGEDFWFQIPSHDLIKFLVPFMVFVDGLRMFLHVSLTVMVFISSFMMW